MADVLASSAGRWGRWYSLVNPDRDGPRPYGDSVTYRLAAEWVTDCDLVEDWGAGLCWLGQFIEPDRYRSVDGSASPFVDVVADLTTYRSDVPAIVIRHVLEHEYRWRDVLGNALASARERLVVVLFTPLDPARTHEIAYADDPGVPDLAFHLPDLATPILEAGWSVDAEILASPTTQYGTETILRCQR